MVSTQKEEERTLASLIHVDTTTPLMCSISKSPHIYFIIAIMKSPAIASSPTSVAWATCAHSGASTYRQVWSRTPLTSRNRDVGRIFTVNLAFKDLRPVPFCPCQGRRDSEVLFVERKYAIVGSRGVMAAHGREVVADDRGTAEADTDVAMLALAFDF